MSLGRKKAVLLSSLGFANYGRPDMFSSSLFCLVLFILLGCGELVGFGSGEVPTGDVLFPSQDGRDDRLSDNSCWGLGHRNPRHSHQCRHWVANLITEQRGKLFL